MPGYTEFITKEKELENENKALRDRVSAQKAKEVRAKAVKENREVLGDVLTKMQNLGYGLRDIFDVPNKEGDSRLYLATGKHGSYDNAMKYNVFLCVDPVSGQFELKQKNLILNYKESIYNVVEMTQEVRIKKDSPMIEGLLSVIEDNYLERSKRFAKQYETGRFDA